MVCANSERRLNRYKIAQMTRQTDRRRIKQSGNLTGVFSTSGVKITPTYGIILYNIIQEPGSININIKLNVTI